MNKRRKIFSFNYSDVSLKEGMFKKQFLASMDCYYKIPDDSLLYGFRKRANLPAPGNSLEGWYGVGVGSIFGQLIGAYAKMFSVTNDEKMKAKSDYLIKEWGKCIESDGYFFYNDKGSVLDLHYEYEKIIGGLLDSYEFTENKTALNYLSKITDWSIRNLSKSLKEIVKESDRLESNEWYTLSENLYRAFEITGVKKYKRFAEEWEYSFFWDKFLSSDFYSDPKHAYSHVNSLNGAARAYIIKGENKYLEIIKNAYDIITKKHIYCTGGYGPEEIMFKENGYLGKALLKPSSENCGNAEIPCGTWAVLKFCKYLVEITGDPKYADWAEKLLYNGIGAELIPDENGNVMYYANYYLFGAQKTNYSFRLPTSSGYTDEWPCCYGTYPQDVTEYYNLIFFHDAENIYINQYVPSNAKWVNDGHLIEISINTEYPEKKNIDLIVKTEEEIEFTINFRVPNWVFKKIKVKINKRIQKVKSTRSKWLSVKRKWKNGDSVQLIFPMELYFSVVDEKYQDIVSLNYGPIVLATKTIGILQGDLDHPSLWIRKVKGEPLTFRTDLKHVYGYPNRRKIFIPFFSIDAHERYYLYNRAIAEWGSLGGPKNISLI